MTYHWRVAITSSDRENIDEHFGHAEDFLIVDLKEDGNYQISEIRNLNSFCSECSFSKDKIQERVNVFADCTALLTAKIGDHARMALAAGDILVFEQETDIERALQNLAKYLKRIKYQYI